jgi:hypothetical protein
MTCRWSNLAGILVSWVAAVESAVGIVIEVIFIATFTHRFFAR